MMVTIDVVTLRRRRDAVRLLRRPGRQLAARPAFLRALLAVDDFGPSDIRRVALLAGWEGEPAPLHLAPGSAAETWRGTFELQRTHGTLNAVDPLAGGAAATSKTGPGAIWTCGAVRLRKVPAFLRDNARVVQELNRMPGLLSAFGVLGLWRQGPWMCTLSFWDDLESGLAFAYRSSPAHRRVMAAMKSGAYKTRENYFARLGLLHAEGSIGGREPFGDAKAAVAA